MRVGRSGWWDRMSGLDGESSYTVSYKGRPPLVPAVYEIMLWIDMFLAKPGSTSKLWQLVPVLLFLDLCFILFWLPRTFHWIGSMAGPCCFPAVEGSNCEVRRAPRRPSAVGPMAVRCPLHWLISSGVAPQMAMAFAAKMLSTTPRKFSPAGLHKIRGWMFMFFVRCFSASFIDFMVLWSRMCIIDNFSAVGKWNSHCRSGGGPFCGEGMTEDPSTSKHCRCKMSWWFWLQLCVRNSLLMHFEYYIYIYIVMTS